MIVTFADGTTEEYEDTPFNSGTEGAIHHSKDGKSVVKLYHPEQNTQKEVERRDRIEKLIHNFNPTRDDPYWQQFFTWPEKQVKLPRVGYRMPFANNLRTLDFYIFPKAYARLKPEEKGWFIGRLATAIKLVSAADRMARMGLCYPDFSHKNIMVEPFEGRMVLIDCDSLTVPNRLTPTVEGTTWYRAPEIVRRTTNTPSVISDRHSLAVILYYWLLRCHPLRGKKIFDPNDPDNDEQLRLGEKALYIEHPTDHSNQLDGQIVKSSALGPELEKLFHMAFVDGLHDGSQRPLPSEWQTALHHAYDHLIPCSSLHCDWRFFIASPKGRLACPLCKQPLQNPQQLPFVYLLEPGRRGKPDEFQTSKANASYVVGWPDRYLHHWHTRPSATPIYSSPQQGIDTSPYAKFEYDPQLSKWYLTNLSLPKLVYRTAKDQPNFWRTCGLNVSIPLEHNLLIQFGEGNDYYRALIEMVTAK